MVYIEKLVCKGFKSFGRDPVTIKLNPGFTCIVGPNGSGKSNVVDAIVFVLGQLSAKTLRANVFSDLLYSPPKPNMPPKAKSAIVELHFNNKDRKLPIDADRVVIARELDESGRSVCRINGKVVTRTQVIDILGHIGVDPNGYNLVLQGEIAQLVQVSPIERRKLIEEIAGISAYDEQKERALKKLAESETNLGKVETQLQERRRQLEKLADEREEAIRYNRIQEQIQKIQIDSIAWNIIKAQRRIETIDQTLAQRTQDDSDLKQRMVEIDQEIRDIEAEIEEIDAEVDRIAGADSKLVAEQYGKIKGEMEHLKITLEQAREDYQNKCEKRKEIEQQIEELSTEVERAKTEKDEREKRLEKLDYEIREVSDEIERLERKLENERTAIMDSTTRLQDLNTQMRSLDEGIAEVRSAIKADNRELGLLYEDTTDAEQSLSAASETLAELNVTIPEKRALLEDMREQEQNKRTELYEVDEKLKRIDAEVRETTKLIQDTREELVRLDARREALKEAEEAFLKKKRAIARVLELRDTGEVEGIHGTVAELGAINPEYSVALEVAAGNRLSYIVVDDDEVATQCVKVLKRERVGRASFIPLNKIKSRSPTRNIDEDGVVGYAIDLVSFNSKLTPAFEFVFSDTIVTEDFETAKRLGFSGRRAVSLDGDLVERSGLVTGGHYHRTGTGLSLQMKDKTPEIESKLAGLDKILQELKTQQEELRKRKKVLDRELQELSKKIYRGNMELERLEETLTENESRVEALKEKIEKNRVMIEELEKQIAELRERDEELTAHRERIRAQRDECNEALTKSDVPTLNQEIKDLKEVIEGYYNERNTLQNEINGLRVAIEERMLPKIDDLEHTLEMMQKEAPQIEKRIHQMEEEYSEKERMFSELEAKREKIDSAVKDKRIKKDRLKTDLQNLRVEQGEVREKQGINERAIYRLNSERSKLENDIVGYMAKLNEMADAQEEIAKRESLPEPTRREIDELDEKILELQRELEALGLVNLKAIQEYDLENEKYEEIVDKKRRLEEEHKEIIAFMEKIEAEKTKKFLQVYNEIADNFSKVFAKLSPGGEANLMLENPEHPLMGGITVRSKPRGKDLVTLEAMSGGEKTLTGLALIFAIQMHNPASFYLFDEIDAALDDVNAHNVALLIKEMAKSSQFIVVSLRDTTVRKADLLIGVSNQNGISRIVSVDLEEVAVPS